MALPQKHKRPWSKQEEGQLKDMYRKRVPHQEIAAKLKRTLNAVESKATELGLAHRKTGSRTR